jgi:hypothetical protein
MANWEKLNKEFDDALDSMTSEDWELLASKSIKQTTRTMKTAVVLSLLVIIGIVALSFAIYYWAVVLNGFDSKEEKEYVEELFKKIINKQQE